MRFSASVFLLVMLVAHSASAAQHEVRVQVVSVLSQTMSGVGVGSLAGSEFKTLISCSEPYTSETVGVVQGPGSLTQCLLASPAHQPSGTVQNRRVEAVLTTEDGQTYYTVLGCQKVYGWCAPLAEHASYEGTLNDKPKWLADYPHRPFYGFIKVSLRPNGNKKVTYEIQYAAKMNVLKP